MTQICKKGTTVPKKNDNNGTGTRAKNDDKRGGSGWENSEVKCFDDDDGKKYGVTYTLAAWLTPTLACSLGFEDGCDRR